MGNFNWFQLVPGVGPNWLHVEVATVQLKPAETNTKPWRTSGEGESFYSNIAYRSFLAINKILLLIAILAQPCHVNRPHLMCLLCVCVLSFSYAQDVSQLNMGNCLQSKVSVNNPKLCAHENEMLPGFVRNSCCLAPCAYF